jgi:hypothetical protein
VVKWRQVAWAGAALALCASAAASVVPGHRSTRTIGAATLSVGNFVLPRGHTIVVGRSLRIHALGTIEIDGSIELDPGAAFGLSAGRIVIKGRIAPVPASRLPLAAAGRPSQLPYEIMPLEGRHSIVVDGTVESQPSQSIVIAVRPSATITIDGTVETKNGIDAAGPAQIGGNAGDVIMNGGPIYPAAKITIAAGAVVRAGDGGQGYWDKAPQETPPANPCGPEGGRNAVTLVGTRGGDGGSVRLTADTIKDKGTIQVGDGGIGGSAGNGTNAPSGGDNQGGVDFHARSGNGGNGGSIETPDNPLQDSIYVGIGGDGGSVSGGAGNGGPNCDGGETKVTVGNIGHNGTSGKEDEHRQPHMGRLSLVSGGRGGNAGDSKHPGGNGGSTEVHLPTNNRSGPIDITSYADGGRGFDACGNATTNATAGGDAGALTMTGAPRASANVDDSFNGGDGGDGHPPGLGGEKGAASASIHHAVDSFQAGDVGLPCTGTHKKKKGSVTSVTVKTTTSSTATQTTETTTTSETSGATGSYRCSGKQITLFDNTNGNSVNNGGTPPSFSTDGKAYCVTYIQTYHWNGGSGAPAGTLGLKRTGGAGSLPPEVGPFPAKTTPGQNNAPNVNWYVDVPQSPPEVIDGNYTCADSGAATWSSNPSSGGAGFCIVYAVPATRA